MLFLRKENGKMECWDVFIALILTLIAGWMLFLTCWLIDRFGE